MSARSLGPRISPASTVDARAPNSALLESAAPLGKPLVPEVWKIATVAAESMAAGGKDVASVAGADKSVEGLWLVVRLYPRAHSQGLAVRDVAFKNCFVGHQYFRAAIGQNAAHFGE